MFNQFSDVKTIGICAHSYEGGALSFLTACREGAAVMGPHMHPSIELSCIPMALSLEDYNSEDNKIVARYLTDGIEDVARAGADFYICPDNTAHIVLERISQQLPIPGLHIAHVVCSEILKNGWEKIGLLGTKWTMNGPVYARSLQNRGLVRMVPKQSMQQQINEAIFAELCQGVFRDETIEVFINAIEYLEHRGAECVILGCTEIPLIINAGNSPLPVIDSTRLQARYAVNVALMPDDLPVRGWIPL